MNKKKCFVITPIGKDGSQLRQDMNEVIKYGIREAMDNYEVIAAHDICEPGSITKQIVDEIAESDITGR